MGGSNLVQLRVTTTYERHRSKEKICVTWVLKQTGWKNQKRLPTVYDSKVISWRIIKGKERVEIVVKPF